MKIFCCECQIDVWARLTNGEEKQPTPDRAQTIKLTPWAGGEMPVELLTPLLVKHRSGSFFCVPAGGMQARGWVHVNRPDDIVGFAVIRIERSE